VEAGQLAWKTIEIESPDSPMASFAFNTTNGNLLRSSSLSGGGTGKDLYDTPEIEIPEDTSETTDYPIV